MKQEAFLDGFVHAFEFFGGVPTEGLFDNLKTAVVKILQGRDRLEQETFVALQAHYLFKTEFCNVRSGNEKGRVEGTVGYIRRNAFVPYPEVQSMDELNDYLHEWCLKPFLIRKKLLRKCGGRKKNTSIHFQRINLKLVSSHHARLTRPL